MALGAPAVQLQLGLTHLAALVVRAAPVLAGELLRRQALHVFGLAQPQQVRLLAFFQRQQDAFVAVAGVSAHQRRSAITPRTFSELVQQPAQRSLGVPAGVLLARADLHVQHPRPLQRPAQRVLANDTVHAQGLRRHRVAAQCGDVRVTPVPSTSRSCGALPLR